MTATATPRVVTTGFDTVVYTAPVEPPTKLCKQLAALKEKAQQKQPAIIDIDGDPFVVSPKGGADWRWILESESCKILLSDNPERNVKAKVELGSLPLWSQGTRAAVARSVTQLSRLTGKPMGFPLLASRVDLTVDFQGWAPTVDDSLSVVSRGRSRDRHRDGKPGCPRCTQPVEYHWRVCCYCAAELHGAELKYGPHPPRFHRVGALDSREFYGRQLFRGFVWGSGKPILVRLYCKTLEIKENSPDKVWFQEVWNRSDGYNPDEPVWRLELQVRRKLLKQLTRSDGADFEYLSASVEHAHTLFRYLVGSAQRVCSSDESHDVTGRWRRCRVEGCDGKVQRPTGWVELRIRTDNQQPHRWPNSPAWAALQQTYFEAAKPAMPATRAKRDDAAELVLARMIRGCGTTLSANHRKVFAPLEQKYGGALPGTVRELSERDERKRQLEYFDASVAVLRKVLEKRGLLDGDDKSVSFADQLRAKIAMRPEREQKCSCGESRTILDEYCQKCGVVFSEQEGV